MPQSSASSSPLDDQPAAETPQPQAQANSDALDALLDEIDSTLQTNAEEFVRSFVQKGGQ